MVWVPARPGLRSPAPAQPYAVTPCQWSRRRRAGRPNPLEGTRRATRRYYYIAAQLCLGPDWAETTRTAGRASGPEAERPGPGSPPMYIPFRFYCSSISLLLLRSALNTKARQIPSNRTRIETNHRCFEIIIVMHPAGNIRRAEEASFNCMRIETLTTVRI